ncbi:hypothetical protein ABZT17_32215 [Streptomyces sp. NPDC005648]|uniref:hypothetical protein n=1 Tax=Streptomyces sp. NPDC005648 TaxID=3157044 RepID=UPI0033BE7C82
MADEQYKWLDRETAEALLRGESLEAVDATARDQAERLAKTLESLTAEPPPSSTELPGEDAAMAAFRAARAARADAEFARAAAGAADARPEPFVAGYRAHPHPADAGLVRIGEPGRGGRGPRRRRRSHFALTAVLAAGMVGGIAYGATSGILPTPFGGHDPGPAASVSAAASNRPLVSPSPNGVPGEPSPDGSTGGSADSATPKGTPGDAPSAGPEARGWWRRQAPSACRDALGGKELAPDRRQALEHAAGGYTPDRVSKYCKTVLAGSGSTSSDGRNRDKGDQGDQGKDKPGEGKGGSGGKGDQNGSGGKGGNGKGGGDDDGHHIAPDGGGRHLITGGTGTGGHTVAPIAPLAPGRLLAPLNPAPAPTPEPTYSAL